MKTVGKFVVVFQLVDLIETNEKLHTDGIILCEKEVT